MRPQVHAGRCAAIRLLVAALASGCLGPVGPDDVEVEARYRFVHDGRVDVLPAEELELVVWVPSDDGWTERPVERRAAGEFVVHDVPQGRYFVRRGTVFYDTDARALSVSPPLLGEPSEGIPYGAKLAVEAKNARFYQGPATVCLTSVRAGLSGLCFGWEEDPYSELLKLGLQLDRAARALPNADAIRAGDDVIVHQLDLVAHDPAGPVLVTYAAARAFSTWSFDMTAAPQGAAATLAGEMYELKSYPFNAAYDRASFEALTPEVHPQARVLVHQPTVEGAVRTPEGPINLGQPPLLFAAVLAPGLSPVAFPAVYGNPLGPTWERFVHATTLYARDYALPGSTSRPITLVAAAEHAELESRDVAALSAAMSPPREITIDGQPFQGDVVVSAAPRLEWATPSAGTVASYELVLSELTDEGGRVRSAKVASFHTRQQQLQLPERVLQRGARYQAVLYARSGDALSVERAAWHTADRVPFASAPAFSGVLSVE